MHAIDLGGETTYDDIPREVCAALLDDAARSLSGREDVPGIELRAVDGKLSWNLGPAAAYATGRPVPGALHTESGRPPQLPAWL